MDNFTLVALGNAAPAPAAVGYNGAIGNVSLAQPATFIADEYRWILNGANQPDLDATISYTYEVFAVAAGNANQPLAQAELDLALPIIGRKIAVYELLSFAHACGVNLVFRNSDTIAMPVGLDATVVAMPHQVRGLFAASPVARAAILSESRYVALCPVANAIHRHGSEGHNWFTRDTNNRRTIAYRACAVAGADAAGMRQFMMDCGHDLYHFLTHASLDRLVDAMTGVTPVVTAANYNYDGAKPAGSSFHASLALPESANDRWPVGAPGKSALYVGFEIVRAMMDAVALKAPDLDTTAILDELKNDDNNLDGFGRAGILDLKDKWGYVIGVAFGFCSADRSLRDYMEGKPSLVKFANNHISARVVGRAIADTMEDVKLNEEQLAAAFANMLDSLAV
jgi:hypothetical protein